MKKQFFMTLLVVFTLSTFFAIKIYFDHADIRSPNSQTAENEGIITGTWVVVGPPIEVEVLSESDLSKLSTRYYQEYFTSENLEREVVYNGNKIRSMQTSPSKKKLGFYFSPNGNSLSEISLIVFDTTKKSLKEIYRNSIRTSNYEWKDDETLAVNYNCGTACMYRYVVSANNGEILDEYQLY